jgi:hypothetical protein
LGQRRGLKNPWAGEEDVFFIHPQNGLKGLILNQCTGGCWFTPAINSMFLKKKNRQKAIENWFFGMVSPHLCLLATVFRVS